MSRQTGWEDLSPQQMEVLMETDPDVFEISRVFRPPPDIYVDEPIMARGARPPGFSMIDQMYTEAQYGPPSTEPPNMPFPINSDPYVYRVQPLPPPRVNPPVPSRPPIPPPRTTITVTEDPLPQSLLFPDVRAGSMEGIGPAARMPARPGTLQAFEEDNAAFSAYMEQNRVVGVPSAKSQWREPQEWPEGGMPYEPGVEVEGIPGLVAESSTSLSEHAMNAFSVIGGITAAIGIAASLKDMFTTPWEPDPRYPYTTPWVNALMSHKEDFGNVLMGTMALTGGASAAFWPIAIGIDLDLLKDETIAPKLARKTGIDIRSNVTIWNSVFNLITRHGDPYVHYRTADVGTVVNRPADIGVAITNQNYPQYHQLAKSGWPSLGVPRSDTSPEWLTQHPYYATGGSAFNPQDPNWIAFQQQHPEQATATGFRKN